MQVMFRGLLAGKCEKLRTSAGDVERLWIAEAPPAMDRLSPPALADRPSLRRDGAELWAQGIGTSPFAMALTTTLAATSPNVPVTKLALPRTSERSSHEWCSFLPPGHTQWNPSSPS